MVNIRLDAPLNPAIFRDDPVDWTVAREPVPYPDAMLAMEDHVAAMIGRGGAERIWLLEHPPVYTAGTSADETDLIVPGRFPVYRTGRGGQYTYHGPGQRVAYVMLNVGARRRDVRAFVSALESWIIATLARFNIHGETRSDRVGVWVRRPELGPEREDKIAAIGIRLKRWVSLHGIAINVDPDLEHFSGIVPCGVRGHGVTSLVDLGHSVTMADVDIALRRSFEDVFGTTTPAA